MKKATNILSAQEALDVPEAKKSTLAYERALANKELDLLLQREDVRRFLATKHRAKDSQAYLDAARQAERELNSIMITLWKTHKQHNGTRVTNEILANKCHRLERYTDSMILSLEHDLANKQQDEKSKDIDIIKNASFLLAAPTAFVTMVKNGLWQTQ